MDWGRRRSSSEVILQIASLNAVLSSSDGLEPFAVARGRYRDMPVGGGVTRRFGIPLARLRLRTRRPAPSTNILHVKGEFWSHQRIT